MLPEYTYNPREDAIAEARAALVQAEKAVEIAERLHHTAGELEGAAVDLDISELEGLSNLTLKIRGAIEGERDGLRDQLDVLEAPEWQDDEEAAESEAEGK